MIIDTLVADCTANRASRTLSKEELDALIKMRRDFEKLFEFVGRVSWARRNPLMREALDLLVKIREDKS